jgi:hypothetical protein
VAYSFGLWAWALFQLDRTQMSEIRRRSFCPALVALATALLAAGCLDVDRAGFTVSNRLDQPIDVTYVRGPDTQVQIINDLTPGIRIDVNGFFGNGECDDASMIATDPSGVVVGRFEGPVCDGMEWLVGRDVPSTSQPMGGSPEAT